MRTRASLSREELGTEFKALYPVSRNLAAVVDMGTLRRHLMRSAREMVVVDAGATCVIHPGGSMRDNEVIAAADERNVAMVFTGTRHFRH